MSENGQSDNQSEASFNIIGNGELVMKIEHDTNGGIGNSELAMKIEDDTNGDKPEDNANMDVDKTMVVAGAASGSEGNTVVSAVAHHRLALLMALVYHQHLHCRLALLMPQLHHQGIGGILLMQRHIGFILHCSPRCRLR